MHTYSPSHLPSKSQLRKQHCPLMVHGNSVWAQFSTFSATRCKGIVPFFLLRGEPYVGDTELLIKTNFANQREWVFFKVSFCLIEELGEGLRVWK